MYQVQQYTITGFDKWPWCKGWEGLTAIGSMANLSHALKIFSDNVRHDGAYNGYRVRDTKTNVTVVANVPYGWDD